MTSYIFAPWLSYDYVWSHTLWNIPCNSHQHSFFVFTHLLSRPFPFTSYIVRILANVFVVLYHWLSSSLWMCIFLITTDVYLVCSSQASCLEIIAKPIDCKLATVRPRSRSYMKAVYPKYKMTDFGFMIAGSFILWCLQNTKKQLSVLQSFC